MSAVIDDTIKTVAALVVAGANLNTIDELYGKTHFEIAVEQEESEGLEIYLAVAAVGGNEQLVEYLIQLGAEIKYTENTICPEGAAIYAKQTHIAKRLFQVMELGHKSAREARRALLLQATECKNLELVVWEHI